MNTVQWATLLPIVCYFALMYFIGVYALKLVNKASISKGGSGSAYMEEYMTGGRNTGGFIVTPSPRPTTHP